MSKPSMPRAKRTALLSKLRAGHDLESAMVDLAITKRQIEAGGDKLAQDIAEAFSAGTARLRGRLMEGALEADNATVLLRLLEKREEAQRALGGGDTGITEIRRIICPMVCEHCGKSTIKGADVVPLTPGPRLVEPDLPEQPEPIPPEPKRRRLFSGVYVDC